MQPLDLNTINPKMRRLVGWLRSKGFETTDSGDGHTNADNGGDCLIEGLTRLPCLCTIT